MKPSEIRHRVLSDHVVLRGMLARIEDLALSVLDGVDVPATTLREEGERLLGRLEAHMGWEDRYLGPALEQADAWGDVRLARLAEDHREQRELLGYELACLRDPTRPVEMVARNLLDLIHLIRSDMAEEEAGCLDPRVLRDDVVTTDFVSG